MQINVAQLLKEPVGSTRSINVEDEIGLESDRVLISGHLTLVRLDKSILVSGEVKSKLSQICSRCVQEFEIIVPIKIEDEFFPRIDINTGLPVKYMIEDGAFTINENHIIDLEEAFRQNLLVTLPMKPLCRPDCAGLCPQCGVNLNEVECGCNRTTEDIRWAELKKLVLAGEKSKNRKDKSN